MGCRSQPVAELPAAQTVKIIEVAPNKWTALTRQNLEHLLHVYDLDPFLFTKEIFIQSKVIPHSHPKLTLNTRNAEHPHKILASFLHEELHWWGVERKAQVAKAITELKKIFPRPPEASESTYLHLIICTLEYEALIHYLNKKEATKIIRGLITQDKVYPWVYTQVLGHHKLLMKVVTKYKLRPKPID